MARPNNLSTKIFLDSGDPKETQRALSQLGFLDGQTTNPSLIAKNPEAKARLDAGDLFSKDEIATLYREVVREISSLIPEGSVSIEVYADRETNADAMCTEGRGMFSWIPNAHIKYPITAGGLEAAERSIAEGMRVNMTLCFSEAQAAAVYAATRGAKKGAVFVSPFVGRLDDVGENGIDLLENIGALYAEGDGHVETLAASVRSLDHLLASMAKRVDIITAPLAVLEEWAGQGLPVPDVRFAYERPGLRHIPEVGVSLANGWRSYDISHELTDKGLDRFASDWNALITH